MSPRPARGQGGRGAFDSPLGPTQCLASLALQNVNPEFRFSTPLSPKIPRQRPCRGKLKPARPLWGAHRSSLSSESPQALPWRCSTTAADTVGSRPLPTEAGLGRYI